MSDILNQLDINISQVFLIFINKLTHFHAQGVMTYEISVHPP